MDDTEPAEATRSVLLRGLWRDAIDGWDAPGALDQLPAARRLLAAGADRDDLVRLVRAVAYEAVFARLDTLDEGGLVRDPDAVGGWVVTEPASGSRAPLLEQPRHPPVRQWLAARLAGGAVLEGGVAEGDFADGVAADRAGLAGAAVDA